MPVLNFAKAEFVKSAASSSQFIHSSFTNVVFAGKSNVGKSSVINCVLNRKNFARVGSTPGKTVHVNYFLIDGRCYFVDLPGYGFAKVPEGEKIRWSKLMESFFAESEINLGVLIVDSRHAPTEDDAMMFNWFIQSGKTFSVLANKTDKLKKSELDRNLDVIRKTLSIPDSVPLIPFSAEKGTGKEELIKLIRSI